jgi:hypothetical protein
MEDRLFHGNADGDDGGLHDGLLVGFDGGPEGNAVLIVRGMLGFVDSGRTKSGFDMGGGSLLEEDVAGSHVGERPS